MGDVCYFTLNDNEIEDLKSKKLSKNKQPNTIKERSVATPKEKNNDYWYKCSHCGKAGI